MMLQERLQSALGHAATPARIVETAEEELYAEEAAGNARQCDYLPDWQTVEASQRDYAAEAAGY